jgi:hypothetical protein
MMSEKEGELLPIPAEREGERKSRLHFKKHTLGFQLLRRSAANFHLKFPCKKALGWVFISANPKLRI